MPPMKRPSPTHDAIFGDTLSIAEIARRLSLTRREIRGMMSRGELDFVEIRGRLRVERAVADRAHRELKTASESASD